MGSDFGPPVKKPKPLFTFGQIPDWIVKNGVLRQMSKNDVKLLVYLCCVRYRVTGNSSRTRKTISNCTGIPLRQVSVHSGRLEMMGVIKKWRRGNRTVYNVRLKAPDNLNNSEPEQMIYDRKIRTHIPRDEEGMFINKKIDRKIWTPQ